MDPDSALYSWLFLPSFWVAVAIVLIGADMVLGFQFFVLSVGVAALIVAGLLFSDNAGWLGDAVALDDWRDIGLWFAGLSVASVLVIRWVFQRWFSSSHDINRY